MSAELIVALATGLLALITAGVGALINSWITARAGVDEDLRDRRLAVYPKLWQATGATPRWPRTEPSRHDLTELHKAYRTWYFSIGGIFLSESARARYGDVQKLLEALLTASSTDRARGTPRETDRLTDTAYVDLMETTSALRTALAQDLDTRRRSSVRDLRRRSRWHKEAAGKATARIERAKIQEAAFLRHDTDRQ
ncbi:hypothetical protein AB0L64_06155 [Kribbella sp. NPDC051936]|uniref:hypothetical protein n=1 Tax=Kribbella sp. NPDC051936 TaxID=3154946 RepID=UPI0034379A75